MTGPDHPESPTLPNSAQDRHSFETICQHASLALFLVNERHECVYLNPAAQRLTGYKAQEFAGRPFHELLQFRQVDGAPYALADRPIAGELVGNSPQQGKCLLVHKAGRFCPIGFVATPIGVGENIGGVIFEARDLSDNSPSIENVTPQGENTERLEQMVGELRRTERRLREESEVVDTINRVGQAIAGELDLQKVVQAVTDATTKLTRAQFGAFFYNLVSRQNESYMLYALSGAPLEAFARFPMPRNTEVFGPTFRGEGVVRSSDIRQDPRYGKNAPYHGMPPGHLSVVSYLAVPVISRTGEVIGGLFFGHEDPGIFNERDERIIVGIAAQTAVAIDNARLYEVEQAAREAKEALLLKEQQAKSDLEKANRMKDEFLATLSHELRTPLNAVLGYATLLQNAALGEKERNEGLQTIERNARLQAQLIEDLLDMNRIISGKIRLDVQLVDLPSIIDAALDTVQPSAAAKNIRIQKLIDPLAWPFKGDPGRIQQVIWNLLSNAVKFTPKEGKIQVLLERVNSHVEISVVDTGEGIAPEFLPFVFDRFRQADASTTRRYSGLGLGLSIVKQLVELHGGSVRAKSPGIGGGSTFIVALPLTAVHPEEHEKRSHPKAREAAAIPCDVLLEGVQVLVVDDEPDACLLVKRLLEHCEAEVTTAHSVAEALRILQRQPIDVLVSDLGMPDEDGYDLIRKVRALGGRGADVPAVALSAFARSEDRTRAALAGFQTHLAKPVEVSELIAVVANLAGRTGKT